MIHTFPTTRAALDNAARQIIARAYHEHRILTPEEEAQHEALICAKYQLEVAMRTRWLQEHGQTPAAITPDNVFPFPAVAQQ
ncbi:MAG: hypothetical protein H3C27_01070 [Opitutaceae bacterium]|nr:hypothetical protein [Opitutaceae bacterium]